MGHCTVAWAHWGAPACCTSGELQPPRTRSRNCTGILAKALQARSAAAVECGDARLARLYRKRSLEKVRYHDEYDKDGSVSLEFS